MVVNWSSTRFEYGATIKNPKVVLLCITIPTTVTIDPTIFFVIDDRL